MPLSEVECGRVSGCRIKNFSLLVVSGRVDLKVVIIAVSFSVDSTLMRFIGRGLCACLPYSLLVSLSQVSLALPTVEIAVVKLLGKCAY